MGPTAFATPPVLMLLLLREFVLASDAVVVPSAKATLFETNPLREDDEEGETEEPDAELEGEGTLMCNCTLAGA